MVIVMKSVVSTFVKKQNSNTNPLIIRKQTNFVIVTVHFDYVYTLQLITHDSLVREDVKFSNYLFFLPASSFNSRAPSEVIVTYPYRRRDSALLLCVLWRTATVQVIYYTAVVSVANTCSSSAA